MKIISVRHIEGPNVYLYKPILVARVHLESWTEKESTDFPGLAEALLQHLPGLAEHHCAKGHPGGFVERLYGGTYFGHICEHVTIEFATLAGLGVHYGKTVFVDEPGHYDIVMECECFDAQKQLLEEAIKFVEALTNGRQPELVASIVDEAREIVERTALGPSTKAIVEACKSRNIPVRRIMGSLLELGYGVGLKRIEATVTDQTSCVATDIASDKEVTKRLLSDAGIPVPYGGIADSEEEALAWYKHIGNPVVVKPLDGRQGVGVSLGVNSEAALKRGYAIAAKGRHAVVVEEHVNGVNVRLLIVAGRCVAASLREPASVWGDGQHSVRALIDFVNRDPRRGIGHGKPLSQIRVDEVVEETLRKQNVCLDTVPAFGERVFLRESANLSTGGEARDVTDEIDDSYIRIAERGARQIGLDICGVDMVIEDLKATATRTNCAVIEVNAAPGIRMHEHPSHGKRRAVAEAIVESLYPIGQTGRIPIISVTGTNGKTTTARFIAHGFGVDGRVVGLTSTGGVYIGGELIEPGDTTGPRSARLVLSDPTVEVAVLETARGGIVRGGLAYDLADVAVITNVSLDHVGQDCLDTLEDIAHVKALVGECVHPHGAVVLNADDPHVMAMSKRFKATQVLVSSRDDNPYVAEHVSAGGQAFIVSNGDIVEVSGKLRRLVLAVRDIPITLGGTIGFHVENALLATAAMRAAGLTRRIVVKALRTFVPESNRGRCMMYRLQNGAHVILDYAHNPAGFRRMGEWLATLPHRELVGVVGVPGDRADSVIEQAGAALAPWFDRFVVKEDEDLRGREPGEVAGILAAAISENAPHKKTTIVLEECEALHVVVEGLRNGDIACMFYEKVDALEAQLASFGAKRVQQIEFTQKPTYALL